MTVSRDDALFYDLVPKDPVENLRFRHYCLVRGWEEKEFRKEFWAACKQDILFYINVACFTYDPRPSKRLWGEAKAIPFITYPYQDDALIDLKNTVGYEDVLMEKSRDMGASWLGLLTFEWKWHFYSLQSFLMVSRIEDLVDKKNDPDSLFWKIDFVHANQPKWLRPKIERNKLSITNLDNLSTIVGASTTSETARGGRRTAILFDEFASVNDGQGMLNASRDTTNSRIFNSTPKGMANAFATLAHKPPVDLKHLRLHWTQHPVKSAGKKLLSEGQRKWVGTSREEEGKWTSPWYEKQCARAAHAMEIAQELDIDYLASDYQFFKQHVLDDILLKHVRPPYLQGELEYDVETGEPFAFRADPAGRLLLWIYPDTSGNPPRDRRYSMGVDVSAGTGASNSVCSVADIRAGEKIAEFATPHMQPHEFAGYAVALARWFQGIPSEHKGAYMVWEANGGHGENFGKEVIKRGFENFYYRRNERQRARRPVAGLVPGFWNQGDARKAVLGDYAEALRTGKYINRSRSEIADECPLYVFTTDGKIVNSKAHRSLDPSGAGNNHGDRVISSALCYKGCVERPVVPDSHVSVDAKDVSCFQARRLKHLRDDHEKQYRY